MFIYQGTRFYKDIIPLMFRLKRIMMTFKIKFLLTLDADDNLFSYFPEHPSGHPGTESAHPETGHESETGGTAWTEGRTPAEMIGTWETSEDQSPLQHMTSCFSHLSALLSYPNMTHISPWQPPPPFSCLPPYFFFALTVNPAESECTCNIVWIWFSSIHIWDDCTGWEA